MPDESRPIFEVAPTPGATVDCRLAQIAVTAALAVVFAEAVERSAAEGDLEHLGLMARALTLRVAEIGSAVLALERAS